ncbi:amidase activity protein [Lysinibacillus phage vB_LfM_LysYB1]|nr:amidase activity protein [Lysinibacillus phage vB_LfM_LysYB1]WAB25247.1 amidase activity protein [Lysinibacillus phage vB_LfM_LysYB2]
MIIQGTQHAPCALVSFSTETGELTLRAGVSAEGFALDGQVLKISTNNDISGDAGTFQIELVASKRWDKVLASNDFVRIQMFRDGDNLNLDAFEPTVMMGLIDDVRKSVSLQGGTPQKTVVVTGRTFAKALINFEVGVIQEAPNATTASVGWLQGRIKFAGSSAADITRQIFNELVFKYMNYTFRNGATLESLVTLNLDSRRGERLYDDRSFISFQGSMQSFLREISNEPFNQLFWEFFGDGKATYVLRETPFNSDSWSRLVVHTITDELVVMDSIGRSDMETYAFFSVGMQAYFSDADINRTIGVLPLWYEPYFNKFGLRRLHRFTAYVGYGNSSDAALSGQDLKPYQQDLFNWNIHNPNFYNGYVTVQGDHRYKVGDRLLYKSTEDGREIEFFIESVSHDFTNFGAWFTRLGVTRGMPEAGKGRFESPWGEYQDYTGGALGAPIVSPTETGGTGGIDGGTIGSGADGSPTAQNVIAVAQSYVGRSTYVFGGGRNQNDINRRVFDCSSFMHHVFKQIGVDFGPVSSTTTDTLAKKGTAVTSRSQLIPGDLVFFNSYKHNGHVGIYMGGDKFIGCQTSKGAHEESMSWWINEYGLGSMRRVL